VANVAATTDIEDILPRVCLQGDGDALATGIGAQQSCATVSGLRSAKSKRTLDVCLSYVSGIDHDAGPASCSHRSSHDSRSNLRLLGVGCSLLAGQKGVHAGDRRVERLGLLALLINGTEYDGCVGISVFSKSTAGYARGKMVVRSNLRVSLV
jgi:hypothetical protein